MALTDEQIERYARHIILKEVGAKGQKKLLNAKVLIIGAGGLGAPAAMYLAAAGVGTIGIADADEVDLSNLQRQIIHQTADVGKAKVQSAKETINAMNPDVTVNTYREFITSDNIMDIIKDYDFVIDGTDNFPAKFLINDACVMAKKPFSHAGIIRFKGQLMTYVPGEGPCYRCVFKNPPPKDAVPTCKQAGVIGAMGGVIGSLQAMEAIKYILGVGDLLTGHLLTYNKSDFDTILEYAKKNLPEEACGLIGGTIENGDKHIKKIYLLTNIDHSNEHFSMDPKEQLAAVKDMRANGLVPLGNWHSHPESPSRPSDEDKRLAYDSKASYMILSLMNIDEPVLNSFHIEGNVSNKEDLRII